jgi:hypothetical protein
VNSGRAVGLVGDKAGPAEVLALRYCLVAISLGLRQALILSLRIADSFGQHLAQFGLGFRRLARRFRWGHIMHHWYTGMPEGD